MRVCLFLVLLVSGCTGIPKGIEPVENFNQQEYLGRWYEIARLDHRFERGLSHVTAEYTLGDGGGIVVSNKGFSIANDRWQTAQGKAKFKGSADIGHLLVSFFGPFYASYVVFELDNYQNAYVTGSNKKNLWFLSREPNVSPAAQQRFKTKVDALGYNTENIIWVQQADRPSEE